MYRSKFEKRVADCLVRNKVSFTYETDKIKYQQPVRTKPCAKCGHDEMFVDRTYTPDFCIKDTEIYLECKGILDRKERKKFEAIKNCHPNKDIRLLFMRDNRIYKGSSTYYSDWAKRIGFTFAIEKLPKQWIKDFKNGVSS